MSRPSPELEIEIASVEIAPARPSVDHVVENIVRDSATDANYIVDSIVPFGGE